MATPPKDRSSRWRVLLELVSQSGQLTVAQAADQLQVSQATIRRDFSELAQQQLVTRTHGGVISASVTYNLPLKYRDNRHDAALDRVAHAAAQLVQPGQVVAFNGGLSTSNTARCLAARDDLPQSGPEPAFTVLTNALNIAADMVLRPYIRTVTLGGVARSHAYELTGPHAIEVLDHYWADLLFLGVDGLCAQHGATTEHAEEAGVNAKMTQRTDRVIVVATASKLGKRTFAAICPLTEIHTVVTDDAADPELLTEFSTQGVQLIVV